jgi:3-oxoacyl-[acyl-carrier protein] reductase
MVPMGRLGKVEDISEMAAYLLSPRASWITGQNFFVNGGLAF